MRKAWPLEGRILVRLAGEFVGWQIIRTDRVSKLTRRDPRGVRKPKILFRRKRA